MAFLRRKIYWVVEAVAFLLPPSPNTAQALASWTSRLRKNKAREASRGSQNQQATSLLILMALLRLPLGDWEVFPQAGGGGVARGKAWLCHLSLVGSGVSVLFL